MRDKVLYNDVFNQGQVNTMLYCCVLCFTRSSWYGSNGAKDATRKNARTHESSM